MRCWWLLIFLLGACAARPAPRATLAITDVRVFDGEELVPRATVLVDGERIVAIGERLAPPKNVEIVDGSGRTLLPGLIDAHVHVRKGEQLEQAVAFGVTTVLDMFHPEPHTLRGGEAPGHADVRSAGICATAPGGHGTQFGPIPTITRPDEAQAFVDARLAEGSDYIKIIVDDGRQVARKTPTLDRPTMAALVAAAHARGKLAVVHAAVYEVARAAVDAGADGLVHLFRDQVPPEDFAPLVVAKRGFIVPTLRVTRMGFGERGTIEDDAAVLARLPPAARAWIAAKNPARSVGPRDTVAPTIARLRDAGVTLLAGSDAPNPNTTFGASLHDELALLVEAGLSPQAALTGATSAAARVFGLEDRGRIAPGLRADLLLVDGDPTRQIRDSRKIVAVWRGGRRFDDAAYAARIADLDRKEREVPIHDLGRWKPSTEGASTVTLTVEYQGLRMEGELVPGLAGATSAGALFPLPAPVDLSSRKHLELRTRGDGNPFVVILHRQDGGRSVFTFTPPEGPKQHELQWSQFEGGGGAPVTAIFIGRTGSERGKLSLTVSHIELP
jgi:imidazolonepropionase-like amidohydrolase